MMKRRQFERLLSQWLDETDNRALCARLDAAAARSPELHRLREQWLALERLIRRAAAGGPAVDWRRLHARIVRQVELSPDPAPVAGLERLLRAQTVIAGRVHWARYGQRVAAAVRQAQRRRPAARLRARRAGLGLAAAAAAILALVLVRPDGSSPPAGFADARVLPVAPASSATAGFAAVRVHRPSAAGPAGRPATAPRARNQLADVFLVIAPASPPARAAAPVGVWGS